MSVASPIATPVMSEAIVLALIGLAGVMSGSLLTYLGIKTKSKADATAAEHAAEGRAPEMAERLIAAAEKLIGLRDAELDALKRDHAEVMRANAALRTEISHMIVQNAQLISQSAQMAGEVGHLRAEISELEDHIDRLVDALRENNIEVPKRGPLLPPPDASLPSNARSG